LSLRKFETIHYKNINARRFKKATRFLGLKWSGRFLIFGYCCLFHLSAVAQSNTKALSIRSDLDETLSGATLISNQGHTLIANDLGVIRIVCECQRLLIELSHMGYETYRDTIEVDGKSQLIYLKPSNRLMEEIVVSSENQFNSTQLSSVQTISMNSIRELPYLLGEQDPIKFIQTLPGISTGTDGNNGYYVRGGGIDQNMIMLDHMELYNTNHLFGFFSMFNAPAIDRIEHVKSGYPASIGGRLSSSMKVYTNNPDFNEVSGSAGFGLLAGKFHLETPVIKGKSSAMISVRKSYLDLLTQNLTSNDSKLRSRTDYRFGDFVVKYAHKLNQNNNLSITAFGGSDDYFLRSSDFFSNDIRWETYNVGAQWNWIKNEKSDGIVYLNMGDYGQHFLADISGYEVNMQSAIKSYRLGTNNYFQTDNHLFNYGADLVFRKIRPNEVSLENGGEVLSLSPKEEILSFESAIFIDDEFTIGEKITIGGGIRLSGFAHIGPFTRYVSTENFIIQDTINHGLVGIVKSYLRPAPRFRMIYVFSERNSMKFSYDRSFQYIHLSPLSSVSLPTDVWVPSSENIKPQSAHQWTLGYHRKFQDWPVSFSIEAYYKLMQNQLEYRDGVVVGYNQGNNFDDVFIFGKTRSRGLEFLLQKDQGITQFQISYTLSKTEKSIGEIQNGRYFPAKYDRTHDLNLVLSTKHRQWTFSGLFKLATGNAITLPVAKYFINGKLINEYGNRNAFRMPTYHRLDLAATLKPKMHSRSTWVFSVYNVYNHANPYYLHFDVSGNVDEYRLDIDLKKVALFPVLPSISYEFSF
jgi:hypothetical protein